jgi:hypothetical protein
MFRKSSSRIRARKCLGSSSLQELRIQTVAVFLEPDLKISTSARMKPFASACMISYLKVDRIISAAGRRHVAIHTATASSRRPLRGFALQISSLSDLQRHHRLMGDKIPLAKPGRGFSFSGA